MKQKKRCYSWPIRIKYAFQKKQLIRMIEEIIKERDTLQQKGIKAREVAEKVYGKDVVLEQYYQFIKKQND